MAILLFPLPLRATSSVSPTLQKREQALQTAVEKDAEQHPDNKAAQDRAEAMKRGGELLNNSLQSVQDRNNADQTTDPASGESTDKDGGTTGSKKEDGNASDDKKDDAQSGGCGGGGGGGSGGGGGGGMPMMPMMPPQQQQSQNDSKNSQSDPSPSPTPIAPPPTNTATVPIPSPTADAIDLSSLEKKPATTANTEPSVGTLPTDLATPPTELVDQVNANAQPKTQQITANAPSNVGDKLSAKTNSKKEDSRGMTQDQAPPASTSLPQASTAQPTKQNSFTGSSYFAGGIGGSYSPSGTKPIGSAFSMNSAQAEEASSPPAQLPKEIGGGKASGSAGASSESNESGGDSNDLLAAMMGGMGASMGEMPLYGGSESLTPVPSKVPTPKEEASNATTPLPLPMFVRPAPSRAIASLPKELKPAPRPLAGAPKPVPTSAQRSYDNSLVDRVWQQLSRGFSVAKAALKKGFRKVLTLTASL